MYIVSSLQGGTLSISDAIVCNSVQELKAARNQGKFNRLFCPDCFLVDPELGLVKQSVDFLKENVWKDELQKRF